jgi:hypothetical protein
MFKIFLTILFLFEFTSVYSQRLKITVEEIFTIGGDENASEEYLFVAPQQIFTDSQNNFYLRDVWTTNGMHSNEIRKYSPGGKYIATIGGRGKGPGEFERIIDFCINSEDDIVIYDEINRRLTLFSTDCKNYKILKIPSNVYFRPSNISPLNSKSYWVANYRYEIENPDIFYIYTKPFSKVLDKFGDPSEIWDQSVALLRKSSRIFRANYTIIDYSQVFIVPKFYDGKIYKYSKKGSLWQMQMIVGKKSKMKSFKEVPIKSFRNGKYKKPAISFGENGKKYTYLIFSQSIGLFPFGKEQIIHFSIQDNDDGKYHFVAELFSKFGEYLGFDVIKKYDSLAYQRRKVIGQSKDGCFFLVENINDSPAIKKIRLSFEN